MIDDPERARRPKRGGRMRGERVVDRGDALGRDVSEAGWVDHFRENPSDAASGGRQGLRAGRGYRPGDDARDRKSTRLNSSHLVISYAVFCLKKKKNKLLKLSKRT